MHIGVTRDITVPQMVNTQQIYICSVHDFNLNCHETIKNRSFKRFKVFVRQPKNKSTNLLITTLGKNAEWSWRGDRETGGEWEKLLFFALSLFLFLFFLFLHFVKRKRNAEMKCHFLSLLCFSLENLQMLFLLFCFFFFCFRAFEI